MERRPRSPSGRNAPTKGGSSDRPRSPKSGLESGFRKKSDKNFQTRDGKEGFRADSGDKKRSFGDKPKRSFDDKPKRDYGDRPKRDFSDKPKRDFGDRPKRDYGDKPKRSYGDKPDFGDRPKRDFGDRPKRDFGDRPKRDYGDKPKRSYGDKPDFGDRPRRSFDDKPKRSFGDKPKRDFGDRPGHDRPKRDFGDKPKRGGFGDKGGRGGPKRSFGDRPARGDAPERKSYGPRINVSVYGLHAVKAALLNETREIRAIYATEDDAPDIRGAIEQALENGINLPELQIVEREQLHRALPREAVHQGVGIDAGELEDLSIQDILRKAEVKKKSIVVMLDHVTDPHNIGAILRSACAFGADAVVVQTRNAPDITGLIAKTASGAVEHIPMI